MKITLDRLENIGWLFFFLGFIMTAIYGLSDIGLFGITFHSIFSDFLAAALIVFISLAVILIIGSTLFSAFSGHSENVKNGPIVIGTIVSVKQTGLEINNQPQLDINVQFTTTDGRLLTASDRKVVPLIDLAKVQPGERLHLRYNPDNPEEIMIDDDVD